VKIYFGGQQYRTKVCSNGGKHPSWNDSFVFNATNDSNMRIEVWDEDTFTADDLIGEGSYNLMQVYNMPSMRSDNGTSHIT
jgi:Ca2+-dependent lipid-binding protein